MSYLSSISEQDWAITPKGAMAAKRALDKIESISIPKSLQRRPSEDYYGQPIEQPYSMNGVSIIPIKGVMLKSAEPVFKLFGFVSHDDVAEDLKTAAASGPRGILLDIDSPGGTHVGTPELAQLVAEIAGKGMLVSTTNRLMASAALYTAAASSVINASPSAVVGSIGTVLEHLDASAYFGAQGLEFQQFASGTYKGMGHPGIPLTQEQKDYLMNDVMQSAEEFKAHMRRNRNMAEDDMQGQWFSGAQALERQIVDFNYHTLEDVMTLF
jgi:signal peptide peptidase SppA